jgi:hypothetical protein
MMHAIKSTWDCDVIPLAEFKEFMGEDGSSEGDASDDSEDGSSEGDAPDDPPPCWGEYEDDDADCQACDLRDECERKTKGGKKKAPKKAGKGKQFGKDGSKVKCPDCKRLVVPNAKDKCPHCLASLNSDVPL